MAATRPSREEATADRLQQEALACLRERRPVPACRLLRKALPLAPAGAVTGRTLQLLWQAGRIAGDWALALAAGMRAAQADALNFRLVDAVLRTLPEALARDWRPAVPQRTLPAALPLLSIVVPSRDDARFAAFDADCARAFARWPHERIRVADARSMYDAYTRGFARARGSVVAFAHDDARFARPDFAARLADALQDADMVGVAGATRVTSPALLGAGHPFLHGAITHLPQDGLPCELAVLSLAGPRIAHAQALDGVFIAGRREWIARVGFDAAGIDGFHLYDLDFTHRAQSAGARLLIACDLALQHASRGREDERYRAAQRAFAERHPALSAPASPHRHWYVLPAADAAHAAALHEALLAAWDLPLP